MKSHNRLVEDAFGVEIAKELIALRRVIFHRQQLLFVAKEAARLCSDNGRDTQNRFWGGLGIVFLMANDHLDNKLPDFHTAEDYRLGIILQMTPSIEASHFHQYQLKMMRSYLMLSKFIEPLRNTNLFFDVPRLFEERTEIPLLTYQSLIFATLSRFVNLDLQKYSENPGLFDITEKWFESTSLPRDQIMAFLSDISATGEEFAEKYSIGPLSPNDFTHLKDKPFFRFGDTLYPLDFSFVAEKFESGPFWRVNELLKLEDRNRFHSFWGQVFEDYINWIFLETVKPGVNDFYPSPMYDDARGGQVCDGIIVSDDAAILMEYKGSTFTAKSKVWK